MAVPRGLLLRAAQGSARHFGQARRAECPPAPSRSQLSGVRAAANCAKHLPSALTFAPLAAAPTISFLSLPRPSPPANGGQRQEAQARRGGVARRGRRRGGGCGAARAGPCVPAGVGGHVGAARQQAAAAAVSRGGPRGGVARPAARRQGGAKSAAQGRQGVRASCARGAGAACRRRRCAHCHTARALPRRLCVLAGDVSPMDVLAHLPVLCEVRPCRGARARSPFSPSRVRARLTRPASRATPQLPEADIPYVWVASKAELGTAAGTKRPTVRQPRQPRARACASPECARRTPTRSAWRPFPPAVGGPRAVGRQGRQGRRRCGRKACRDFCRDQGAGRRARVKWPRPLVCGGCLLRLRVRRLRDGLLFQPRGCLCAQKEGGQGRREWG